MGTPVDYLGKVMTTEPTSPAKYARPQIEFLHQVSVDVIGLAQSESYEGLLAGLPTKEMNARRIEQLRAENPGVHLLPPVETPIEWTRPRPYPFGTPASLPLVLCVSRLRTVEDGIYERTATFAWFQDTWAFPIETSALTVFRTLDWSEHTTRQEL